jgi:hypothetical protein
MTDAESLSWAHLTINVGKGAYARCHAYPASAPILSIIAGTADVSFGTSSRAAVTDADVEFAFGLARAAAQYASECTRLRAEQSPDAQPADQPGADARDCAAQST